MKVLEPPVKVAWAQAVAGIRVRSQRQLLSFSGIALASAVVTLVLALRVAAIEAGSREVMRLTWVTGASLLLSLVGMTNSMLLSVLERVREIGTIKCLGASDGFIVKVFLLEATILGVTGCLVGAMFGGVLALGARVIGELPPSFGQVVAVGPLGFASCLGVVLVSALSPALYAARLPAVVALRSEV